MSLVRGTGKQILGLFLDDDFLAVATLIASFGNRLTVRERDVFRPFLRSLCFIRRRVS